MKKDDNNSSAGEEKSKRKKRRRRERNDKCRATGRRGMRTVGHKMQLFFSSPLLLSSDLPTQLVHSCPSRTASDTFDAVIKRRSQWFGYECSSWFSLARKSQKRGEWGEVRGDKGEMRGDEYYCYCCYCYYYYYYYYYYYLLLLLLQIKEWFL